MKERPILFSAPMVRAILDGSKAQTRRVVKPYDPAPSNRPVPSDVVVREYGFTHRGISPYGQPGGRLWVREAWRLVDFEHCDGSYSCAVEYLADGGRGPRKRGGVEIMDERLGGRPSIHMPRWASRIDLEVTAVRVERLQDISESDAYAEGVMFCDGLVPNLSEYSADELFSALWESINGPGSWDANPWIWVIEFKRGQP